MSRFSLKKYKIGGEEVILGLIIILQFLDFFEVIGTTGDYVKKIISWAALGYLVYKIGLSKLFVGKESSFVDKLLIFGYFSLTFKNLVSYAGSELDKSSAFLAPFFNFLVSNSQIIEVGGIYLGLIILLFASLRMALDDFRKPSIVGVFHLVDEKPRTFKELIFRFFKVFLIVFGFFVVFFNLIMEWLAIAIDAPLLMFGLSFYLLFLVRHFKGFSFGNFLVKFGDFGSYLYSKVLKNLRYKKTFISSLIAIIILHVITDAYTFIIPFLLGFGDDLYRSLFLTPHLSFLALYSGQLASLQSGFLGAVSLFLIYIGNVIALLFFLLFPVYLWFVIFREKWFYPPRLVFSVVIFSIGTFLFSPVFKIQPLSINGLVGVDIFGIPATSSLSFFAIVLICFSMGLLVEWYSAKISHEFIIISGLGLISLSFLFFYLGEYLFSLTEYMFGLFKTLFSSGFFVLLFFFVLVYLFLVSFYFISFGGFVWKLFLFIKKEFVAFKKSGRVQ